MSDVLAKLDFVSRENFHAFAAARNRDIPLLLIRRGGDRRIREQDIIHGFALGGVGRDGVAAHELAVIFRQRRARHSKQCVHRHEFVSPSPVRHWRVCVRPGFGIGLELQSVASGQRKFFRLANRDSFQILEWNRPDAIAGLNQQMLVGDAAQFSRAAGFETGQWGG